MRAPTLFLAFGLTGCVLGSTDHQPDDGFIGRAPTGHEARVPTGAAEQLAQEIVMPTDAAMDPRATQSSAPDSGADVPKQHPCIAGYTPVYHSDGSMHCLKNDDQIFHDTAKDAILPVPPTSEVYHARSEPTQLPASLKREELSEVFHLCCAHGLSCCHKLGDLQKKSLRDDADITLDNADDTLDAAKQAIHDAAMEGKDELCDHVSLFCDNNKRRDAVDAPSGSTKSEDGLAKLVGGEGYEVVDAGEAFLDGLKSVMDNDDDDKKRTAAPEPVRPPPFFCPGPCTDCAPAEQLLGHGAIPTPGTAEIHARGHPVHTPGFVTTKLVDFMDGPATVVASMMSLKPTPVEVAELAHNGKTLTISGIWPSGTENPEVDIVEIPGFPGTFTTTGLFSSATEDPIAFVEPAGLHAGLDARQLAHLKPVTPGYATTKDFITNGMPASAVISVVATKPSTVGLGYLVIGGQTAQTFSGTVSAGPSGPEVDGFPIAELLPTKDYHDEAEMQERQLTGSTSSPTSTVTLTLVTSGAETTPAPPSVTDSNVQTVTIVDHGSAQGSLIPTTDSDGNPVWVTRMGDWANTTTTMTLAHLTATLTASASASSVSVSTVTVYSNVPAPTSTAIPTFTATHIVTYTETMFDPVRRCTKRPDPYEARVSVAHLFGTEFLITTATQTFNNYTVVVTQPSPEATLFPLSRYQDYVLGLLDVMQNADPMDENVRDIMDTDLDVLRHRHPSLNWPMVAELSYVLCNAHPNGTMSPHLMTKYAVMWLLEHPEVANPGAPGSSCIKAKIDGTPAMVTQALQTLESNMGVANQLAKRDAVVTHTVAKINGVEFPVTGASQTYHGTPLVVSTAPYDIRWAAQQTEIPDAPVCVKGSGSYNKLDCKVAKCMMKHYKPINITTIFPAALLGDGSADNSAYGYFTQSTSLTAPHFGVTKAHHTYYPTKITAAVGSDGRVRPTAVAQKPDHIRFRRLRRIEGETHVWDYKTCCAQCRYEVHHRHVGDWRYWVAGGLGLLGLLFLLAGCLGCIKALKSHRARKRTDPNASMLNVVPFVGRKNTTVVTDPATGQPITEVVQVTPATASSPATMTPVTGSTVVTSPAGTGTPATATTTAAPAVVVTDDGKGTMGRKAEEGRGKVQFAEGAAPPAAAPNATKVVTTPAGEQVVTTAPTGAPTPAPATTTEHVEPVPAQHDGAMDGVPTGRQMADMGSMRGRRKQRNDGAYPDLLNVRF